MDIYSNLRRNIIVSNKIYRANVLFKGLLKEDLEIDNPEFYDIETHTLKLGNLCIREIDKNTPPTISFGENDYTTYCSLLQLSQSLTKDLQMRLHKDIDIIYNFLRRDLSIDNRRKFHNLIKNLMSYDNQANSFNLVSSYIQNTDSADEINISLDLFRKKGVDESDIENFLKKAKHTGYKAYERSFIGDHFKINENKLFLRYKGEEETRSIYQITKDVLKGKIYVKEAINSLYKLIVKNYVPLDMVKGDLECIKDVLKENGDIVIASGDIIEVKKLDHGGDSYLSEFFAIYKNSKLPKDALTPTFIKTYNLIIDGLFEKFDTSGKNILKDIKKNFTGIIYSENIFIKSSDIDLYWSNKGRSSCSKDHRLSIRYKINKSVVDGFIYQKNVDFLEKKEININLSNDYILCPILKPKITSESFKLEDVSNLLIEGRLEDIIKKYKDKDDGFGDGDVSDIRYLSGEDPSGNNKYLDWMVKIYFGLGKDTENFSGAQTGSKQGSKHRIIQSVKKFYKNIQRIKNKDINSYPNLGEFELVVNEAEEKRKLAELEKEAKKQKTVIYEDDKWFVVSPHSWKASCYYGAGTKWCVTTKNTSNHWDRYSRRASFFFIVDKTKDQKDPNYKVAYRKIGSGDKYELWDAADTEITRREHGVQWFENLPNEIKERVNIYHEEKYPKGERPDWVDDDPKAQALINHLGDIGIEYIGDDYYDLSVYDTDEGYFVAAENSEMDDAMFAYYDDYSDEDLIENWDYDGYWITLYDEEGYIDEEADSYMENINDDEALENAGLDGEKEELEEEIESFRDALGETEDEEEVEDIESQIETLTDDIDRLVMQAKESVRDHYVEGLEDCLSDGVVDCLIHDKSLFRNTSELFYSGLVELDRTGLIDSVVSNGDYDDLTRGYGHDEEQDDDGDWLVVFEIDY